MYDMTDDEESEEIIRKPWYPSPVKRPGLYLIQPKKKLLSGMVLTAYTSEENPQKGGKINKM